MRKVIVSIEKGKDFYSAYTPPGFIFHAINGQGKTVAKAITDFELAFKEMKEMYLEDKEPIPEELLNVEFEYNNDNSAIVQEKKNTDIWRGRLEYIKAWLRYND